MNPAHQFIAIEGNIGAGKTTLCNKLADDFNLKQVLEEFSDNPFLPLFYKNPKRYAFSVELFFMTERHKQLQESFAKPDIFQQVIVSDYFFTKTLLFAKQNLDAAEYRLFQRLFNVLNANFPSPDLLVYLHRPVDALQKNISNRGRSYEKGISDIYLQNIQNAYLDYFKQNQDFPILIMDIGNLDFVKKQEDYQLILDYISSHYTPGTHTISFSK